MSDEDKGLTGIYLDGHSEICQLSVEGTPPYRIKQLVTGGIVKPGDVVVATFARGAGTFSFVFACYERNVRFHLGQS
jgi:hypothetical protein